MAPRSKTTRLVAASPGSIAAAAACLRAGGLVAVPTETVYGLAADATSDAAVATIYAAKDRPAINPLIAHVLDLEAAREHAVFGPEAERLANAFWPGPLTLVLPVAPTCRISLLARAGLDTVALRSPAQLVTITLDPGYDTPFVMARLAHGDLGYTIRGHQPVVDVILQRLPNTLLLMVSALGMALVFGILAGWVMAIFAGRWPWRKTARACNVPKVMIWATRSAPYFSWT